MGQVGSPEPPPPEDIDNEWELVGHEEAQAPAPTTPETQPPAASTSKHKPQAKEPCGAEVLTAKVVYCVLCLLDSAIKMFTAAEQVARSAGAAGVPLLRKFGRFAILVLKAVQAFAEDLLVVVTKARQGAASLIAGLASVMGSLGQMICQLISMTVPAADSTVTQLKRPAVKNRRHLLQVAKAPALRANCWARKRYTRLDPTGRLPAAARCAYKRARQLPPGVYMVVGGGLFVVLILAVSL